MLLTVLCAGGRRSRGHPAYARWLTKKAVLRVLRGLRDGVAVLRVVSLGSSWPKWPDRSDTPKHNIDLPGNRIPDLVRQRKRQRERSSRVRTEASIR